MRCFIGIDIRNSEVQGFLVKDVRGLVIARSRPVRLPPVKMVIVQFVERVVVWLSDYWVGTPLRTAEEHVDEQQDNDDAECFYLFTFIALQVTAALPSGDTKGRLARYTPPCPHWMVAA